LFILTKVNLGQIPINGFCKYESFIAEPNFNGLLALNFNNDSYSDLALFGGNKILSYQGEPAVKFDKPKSTLLNVEISGLKQVNQKTTGNLYVFISRRDRKIGLLEFSSTGTPKIIKENKLPSYPENMNITDLNRDGTDDILLCGSSFEGLSIFTASQNELTEKRIFREGLYSRAVFIDLNNDGFADIAAVDRINNSIIFFYNYGSNIFKQVRKINLNERINDLQATDINLDGYKDLIISSGREIKIILGDAFSSYNKIIDIHTTNIANNFITRDFNSDGLIDIAYLNRDSSTISIIFARDQDSFYPEITYIKKNNLTDVIPFYSKFVNGLLAYDKSGRLYLIDRLRTFADSTQIVLNSSPYNINYFDAGNDKVCDLCYFDKDSKSLNIIVRNSSGIPENYYSVRLLDYHQNLIVDDMDPYKKFFYCYTTGKRFIEIISIDFNSNIIIEENLYAYGPIEDLRLERNNNDKRARIYVLSNRFGELNLSIINYKDFRYTSANSSKLAYNVIKAKLLLENPLAIFYWENGKNSVTFNKMIINNDLKPENYVFKFTVPYNNYKSITLIIGDILNSDRNDAISFIQENKIKEAIITAGNSNYKINLGKRLNDLETSDEEFLHLGELRFNGLNKLTVYNEEGEYISKLDIIYKSRMLLPSKVVSTKNLESYFIKNMSFKHYHVVYVDKIENCITLKEIT
jgi:hypothetical protein